MNSTSTHQPSSSSSSSKPSSSPPSSTAYAAALRSNLSIPTWPGTNRPILSADSFDESLDIGDESIALTNSIDVQQSVDFQHALSAIKHRIINHSTTQTHNTHTQSPRTHTLTDSHDQTAMKSLLSKLNKPEVTDSNVDESHKDQGTSIKWQLHSFIICTCMSVHH
jgi:hypothetical protein